jgi:RNA polymerase sigma-70 factor (ECF subfamily)
MDHDADKPGSALEPFRDYLCLLARLRLDPRLLGRVEPARVVGDVLREAGETLHQYRGCTPAQIAAWLRRLLARRLGLAVRELGPAPDDPLLDQELAAAVEETSARLAVWLAADQATPQAGCAGALELARALARLPEAHRTAVELRYCQGWTIAAIARHLGRPCAAVAGLLHRGLQQVRAHCQDRGDP